MRQFQFGRRFLGLLNARRISGRNGNRQRRLFAEPLERREVLAAVTPIAPFTLPALGSDQANDVAFDTAGNRYLTGYISQTVDFDPGPGDVSLASAGGLDIFVAKYAPDNSLVWARGFGGTGSDNAHEIVVDRNGGLLVRGTFNGTVSFGSTSLTAAATNAAYLARLDAAGNVAWAKSFGAQTYFSDAAIDDRAANPAQWKAYLVGNFTGTQSFGSQQLSSTSGKSDGFLAQVSLASGAFDWTKKTSGKGDEYFDSVAFDATGSGALFITGRFTEQAKLGSTTLNASATKSDGLVTKANTSGTFQWAKTLNVNSSYNADRSYVATAGGAAYITSGIYIAGQFGNIQVSGLTPSDAYVAKISASGSFQWVTTTQTLYPYDRLVRPEDIATDSFGNVFVAGTFSGHIQFDNDAIESAFLGTSSNYGYDGFISQLDTANGQYVKTWRMGGTAQDYLYGVATDAAGNVAAAGSYGWTADFPDGTVLTTPSTSAAPDLVVVNFSATASAPAAIVARAGAASSRTARGEAVVSRFVAVAANRVRSTTVESASALDPASVDNVLRTVTGRRARSVVDHASDEWTN